MSAPEELIEKTKQIFAPLIERLKYVKCVNCNWYPTKIILHINAKNSSFGFEMSANWDTVTAKLAKLTVSKHRDCGEIVFSYSYYDSLDDKIRLERCLNSLYNNLLTTDEYKIVNEYEEQLDALNSGITNLRQVSGAVAVYNESYLSNIDNLLYLKLLGTHFEYTEGGEGYREARMHFEKEGSQR